jgi:hypothetical protein
MKNWHPALQFAVFVVALIAVAGATFALGRAIRHSKPAVAVQEQGK